MSYPDTPAQRHSLVDAGLYVIASADEGLQTTLIDYAIEQLQAMKYTRENMPF